MTPEQITAAARDAYYLTWDQLTEAAKTSRYATAAQTAAADGRWTDAAALLLAATVAHR